MSGCKGSARTIGLQKTEVKRSIERKRMMGQLIQVVRLALLGMVIVSWSTVAVGKSAEGALRFERASFKVTYVRGDERIQRARVSADSENVKDLGIEELVVSGSDSIAAVGAIVNEKGEPASVSQLYLRFLNKQTMEDNIYVLQKKGRDMKLDFGLRKEVKKDLGFWQHDASYRVEMIYGDLKLVESGIWVITDDMRFSEESKDVFQKEAQSVFNFDVGVKWRPGPEFEAPVPEQEKRAGTGTIMAALAGVIAPFFVLFGTWLKMGALRLKLPDEGKANAIAMETLVLCHAVALGMFWWQWNIVTTWKFMGVLMVPTLVFARYFLRDGESER